MAVTITRTAWIDDDGSGTTGTVLNNAEKTAIYNQIDGALAKVAQLAGPNTFATPQSISGGNPQLSFVDTIAPVDLRSFRIIDSSQLLLFQSITDANALVQTPLILDRLGNAKVGADLYEKGRTSPMGHWTDIAHNAANFTATGGTWTVPPTPTFTFTAIGKTLVLSLQILTSTIGGTPANLSVALPPGYTVLRTTTALGLFNLGEVVLCQGAGNYFVIYRQNLTAFAASACRLDITIPLAVQ